MIYLFKDKFLHQKERKLLKILGSFDHIFFKLVFTNYF